MTSGAPVHRVVKMTLSDHDVPAHGGGFSGIAARWKLRKSRRSDVPSRAGVADPRATPQATPGVAPTGVEPPRLRALLRRLTRASAPLVRDQGRQAVASWRPRAANGARFTTVSRGNPDFTTKSLGAPLCDAGRSLAAETDMKAFADELLLADDTFSTQLFSREAARALLRRHQGGDFDHTRQIFSLLSFELWARRFW